MNGECVIVGASHAGAQLAVSLRQEGWGGPIALIGEEPWLPYHRPPLSKGFFVGDKTLDDILIRDAAAYKSHAIDVVTGVRVAAIDRAGKSVILSNGTRRPYEKLALCTGASVRTLPIGRPDLTNVFYLRTFSDVAEIRRAAVGGARAVIIGGGYIGLETAASLKAAGLEVTVLEAAPRVLARVTAPAVSAFYKRVHREEGVNLVTGATVTDILGEGTAHTVTTSDGTNLPADLVIAGIGVAPRVELAEGCGLKTDNGIVVDQFARTEDPDIVAAGDCTMHPSPLYGWLRLESVANAVEQARTAAATLCGKERPHDSVPWFWSDQFDLKLQIAGLNHGYDTLALRGDPEAGRSFAAFYLREGKIIAADCINRPAEFMLSKRLVAEGRAIDPAALSDDTRRFKEVVAEASR